MRNISLLKDAPFLRKLDLENVRKYYVKILVLDQNEVPIKAIEGKVSTGNISINGSSNVRRAGSLTFLADEEKNDLTNIDNLLSINKKIKVLIGIENNIDDNYDKIIWFNQGIFIISQPSLQHGTNGGVTITLQIKDKMCLLNGENGGTLPTSTTFHEYNQIIGYDDNDGSGYNNYPSNPNNYTVYKVNGQYCMWDATEGWKENSEYKEQVGEIIEIPQRIYDIIQTLVCNFGNESIAKIIINDIPLENRTIVRYVGSETLYYNNATGIYTEDETVVSTQSGEWLTYGYNEDCGYVYTDFTYPGDLISAVGDNICSVLDKIKNTLGNFEYYYDVDGNFIFQEKKNYLNTQYDPVIMKDEKDEDNNGFFILDKDSYYVDYGNTSKSIYTFDEGSALINSYSNTPNYGEIRNDYHIWGKQNNGKSAVHYHIAIKDKPLPPYEPHFVVCEKDTTGEYTGRIHIAKAGEVGKEYTAQDWRAELYLRGMEKQNKQQRPDVYEQELLDFWDSIYNMQAQEFKTNITVNPNDLNYWIDYINPSEMYDISVDSIGTKILVEQNDKINRLYNTDIPNVVIINADATIISQASVIGKCEDIGQSYARVPGSVYHNLALGTTGYTAQETARNLLYQHVKYNEAISITSIPIYYLEANNLITVQDRASGIYGDYVINSINLPLDGKNTMTISASRALNRI